MNSIILCEGNDDLWMIGYFLHKACNENWRFIQDKTISDNFKLPEDTRRSKSEVYTNGTDKVVIYSVGGKDSFKKPIEFISKINNYYPNERFQQVVVVRDRDKDTDQDILNNLQEYFESYSASDYSLKNRVVLKDKENVSVEYVSKETEYTVNVAVIVIPFDCEGALETMLTKSISDKGEEESIICELSNEYVDDYINSVSNSKYLTKQREEIKAKFSALMAIINPTSSTDVLNDVFMEFEWEKSTYIRENFKLLVELFS